MTYHVIYRKENQGGLELRVARTWFFGLGIDLTKSSSKYGSLYVCVVCLPLLSLEFTWVD